MCSSDLGGRRPGRPAEGSNAGLYAGYGQTLLAVRERLLRREAVRAWEGLAHLEEIPFGPQALADECVHAASLRQACQCVPVVMVRMTCSRHDRDAADRRGAPRQAPVRPRRTGRRAGISARSPRWHAEGGPRMAERFIYGEDRRVAVARTRRRVPWFPHAKDLGLPSAESSPYLEGIWARERTDRT